MKRLVFIMLLAMLAVFVVHTAHAATYENETAVGITGPAVSVSLVNQNPDPAIAGSTVEVRLSISNGGQTTVEDLTVELVPSYPFTLVPGESTTQDIGTVGGYQGQFDENEKIIKYTVLVDKDANADTYDLKINLRQKNSIATVQKEIAVDVTGRQSAEVIHIDQTIIVPGKQSPLTFTINNVGNAPLKDITFSWSDEDGAILPVGSDNTKYIKYIDVDNSANVQYQVVADTNAVPGLYKLNLRMTFTNTDGGQQNLTTMAGVYIGGGTDFSVALSDSSTAGTSFSIANTGSNPAYSVSISIPEQPGWRVTGSDSAIIGNLNKGDYTVTSFTLESMTGNTTGAPQGISGRNGTRGTNTGAGFANSSMRSPQTVLVRIDYSDTTGERRSIDKQVRITTQSSGAGFGAGMPGRQGMVQQQNALSQYKWYIIGLVVLAALVFGYAKYKKKKLMDPDFKLSSLYKKNDVRKK